MIFDCVHVLESFECETVPYNIIAFNSARLNDLVLVSENQFYVTCSLKWSPLELFLHLRFGEVLFYDGSRVSVAAGGHIFANGINISPDHRFVVLLKITDFWCLSKIISIGRWKINLCPKRWGIGTLLYLNLSLIC